MKRTFTQKISSIFGAVLAITLYLSLIMGSQLPDPVQQIGSALLLLFTVSAGVMASYLINTANGNRLQLHVIHSDKKEEIRKAA